MSACFIRMFCLPTIPDLTGFRKALLFWFSWQRRDLPWRRTRDPYAVWISEIMLQQTRVAAVIPYYERFMARFPDIASLANAPEEHVLAHWAGLGYYYRARHLHRAAKHVRNAGAFPSEYVGIRALPGIGDYTAGAIASISFNLPHAVLDGNVFRVLSRILADGTNIASVAGKRHFARLASVILDKSQPGDFNQAVMELGATVCLPKNPQCLICPVSNWCRARQAGSQADLPVKIVERKSVTERRILLWIEQNSRVLAWQRPSTSRLMPGFWELPECQQLPDISPEHKMGEFRHGITFHNYIFEVWAAGHVAAGSSTCEWVGLAELTTLPVSTVFRKALRLVNRAQRQPGTHHSVAASSG